MFTYIINRCWSLGFYQRSCSILYILLMLKFNFKPDNTGILGKTSALQLRYMQFESLENWRIHSKHKNQGVNCRLLNNYIQTATTIIWTWLSNTYINVCKQLELIVTYFGHLFYFTIANQSFQLYDHNDFIILLGCYPTHTCI